MKVRLKTNTLQSSNYKIMLIVITSPDKIQGEYLTR